MTRWLPVALALVACQRAAPDARAPDARAPDAAPDAAPASAAPVTAAPAAPVRRFAASLMGTPFRLLIASPRPPAEVAEAADAVFHEIERVEHLMSEWRPDSAISAVNLAAGKAPVQVPAEVADVVGRALAVSRDTDGAFDPTWAALRGLWDFRADPPRLPRKSALAAAVARVGYAKVQIDAGPTVFLPQAGMALGLGGIAKGYAIDRAAALLRARGFDRFIVDGGGDLYVAGEKRPGEPWVVGVRHPRGEGLLAELPVRDAAIVTSGDYERFFELGGRRYHHIIDVRTGMPADRSVAVTVIAPDATRADALATAFFVEGPAAVERARRLGVEAAILAPDGRIFATPGLSALGERFDGATAPPR